MTRRKPKIEIYKARDGWRWRLRAPNGRLVAESGEALKARSPCAWIDYKYMLADCMFTADVVRK